MGQIRRGDIFYANLEPVVGSEQGGVRPVVVIQNNTGNQFSSTVIVAAITDQKKSENAYPCAGLWNRIVKTRFCCPSGTNPTLDRKRVFKIYWQDYTNDTEENRQSTCDKCGNWLRMM